MDNNEFIATVSQVNRRVGLTLKKDAALSAVSVKGEVSNFVRHYKSGHIYFTLKDSENSLKCVMFALEAESLNFTPENGQSVIARGKIQVYERDGVYQLYTNRLEPERHEQEQNPDSIFASFLKLKEKLQAEGVFSNSRTLPPYPQKICLITAKDGAALQDIISVFERRYPVLEVLLIPVTVQGKGAPDSIVKALRLANGEKCDIIILARGGGSTEDLWGFNDEDLARAVYASRVPVISAVGHETDFTIADFAADLRAPTPSAAAELATPDLSEIIPALDNLMANLKRRVSGITEKKLSKLNYLVDIINSRVNHLILHRKRELESAERVINALNPEKVFKRGYAAVFDKDGRAIKTAENVGVGDELDVKLAYGKLSVVVLGCEAPAPPD
ncbi:MAG: exodeoxyribonuclease VII large subunit [Oscillospiraceae bacterium]|nr:exodeoxyribonuclease VII large subunit [Oscillospiraceae bacterium]